MNKVIIDRKCWGRKQYCSDHGKCCAVGFIAKSKLQNQGIKPTIELINYESAQLMNNSDYWDLTDINDSQYGKERENNLRKWFKKHNFRLIIKN